MLEDYYMPSIKRIRQGVKEFSISFSKMIDFFYLTYWIILIYIVLRGMGLVPHLVCKTSVMVKSLLKAIP